MDGTATAMRWLAAIARRFSGCSARRFSPRTVEKARRLSGAPNQAFSWPCGPSKRNPGLVWSRRERTEVIGKINHDVIKVISNPVCAAVSSRRAGLVPITGTPEEFAAFIARRNKTAAGLRDANIRARSSSLALHDTITVADGPWHRGAVSDAIVQDDHTRMRTVADFLDLVARAHVEFDAASIDLGDHGFGGHLMSNGSSGEVTNVDFGARRSRPRNKTFQDCMDRIVISHRNRAVSAEAQLLVLPSFATETRAHRCGPSSNVATGHGVLSRIHQVQENTATWHGLGHRSDVPGLYICPFPVGGDASSGPFCSSKITRARPFRRSLSHHRRASHVAIRAVAGTEN